MGIETILFAAFTGLKAISQMNAAKKQAKQVVQEGEVVAKEKAKQVRYAAARQTSSFLNSGLTLEGTPSVVIGETFSTGLEDINQIRNNYNTKSKNLISAGRQEAISTIVGSFAGSSMGGSMGSMFETAGSFAPESFAFGLNKAGFGNTAYDMLEMKDARG